MRRSHFNLSATRLHSFDQGQLVPIGCEEVIPGDVFRHSTSALIRTTPLVTPVMHPVKARIHHFFVPTRLIWEDFEPFITGGPEGNDASAHPVIACPATTGFTVGSKADHLGVKPGVPDQLVSALPFRACTLIENEFFRDQDLVPKLPLSLASGLDTTTSVALQKTSWERDRFTLARLTPQKGPAAFMPLGESAPVTGIGKANQTYTATGLDVYETDGAGVTNYSDYGVTDTMVFGVQEDPDNPGFPNIRANLAEALPPTITALRTAFALQQYAEARSLYGSRYTDYLAYLGVKSSDARLQRPEYLAGGVETIQFSEVVSTSPGEFDSEELPLGTLGGHGLGALKSNKYQRFFEEHGFVITFMSVVPKTIYGDGLSRMWNRRTKEDYFQLELQHVGQDEVLYKEVKMDHTTPDGTFGYIDRYDEYRRRESSVHGEFRTSLSSWHMARLFGSDMPALNASFVQANPTDRIYAATSPAELQVMISHRLKAKRIVDKSGVPRSLT